MKAFFEGVGSGDTAGVWSKTPDPRPDFRAKYRRQLDAQPRSARPRRCSDARPRPRQGRGLLGRGLRLHRDQGPAGGDRRPGGLREPPRHLRPPLHRRPAAARAADRRHRPRRGRARPEGHGAGHAPRPPGARSRPAGGGRHRLHRRDDRRRRDAGGHRDQALPAAHHRRGPVAERRPGAVLAVDRVRPAQGAGAPPRGGRQAPRQHHRPRLRHLQHALDLARSAASSRGSAAR